MRVRERVGCTAFPCRDVAPASYVVPGIDVDPKKVTIALISEAAPSDPKDYYYAPGTPLFQETTVQAFQDAGARVSSIRDIVKLGVYLTTAVKCGKIAYAIKTETIRECSKILEQELALFPNLKVILLMGDVAIKAMNAIAARVGAGWVIPAGSIYKIRSGRYTFQGKRVFPSYLQAGPSFFIEKSKRRMTAEDIAQALRLTARP